MDKAFESQTSEGIFPNGAEKTREYQPICRKGGTMIYEIESIIPGRYDRSQLKERTFQGMHPHLQDSMQFLYMKDDVGYEEF